MTRLWALIALIFVLVGCGGPGVTGPCPDPDPIRLALAPLHTARFTEAAAELVPASTVPRSGKATMQGLVVYS